MATRTSRTLLGLAGLVVIMAFAGFMWPGVFRYGSATPQAIKPVEQEPEALPPAALKLLDLGGSEWKYEDNGQCTHQVELSVYNGSDYVVHGMEVRVVLKNEDGSTVVDRVLSVNDDFQRDLAYPKSVGNTVLDVGIALKEGQTFESEVLSAVGTKIR